MHWGIIYKNENNSERETENDQHPNMKKRSMLLLQRLGNLFWNNYNKEIKYSVVNQLA